MLMSDVTYLMDESLSKLTEIHQIQLEMRDQAAWEAQTPVSRWTIMDIPWLLTPFCDSNIVKNVKVASHRWKDRHNPTLHLAMKLYTCSNI